jgi:hypothetical protein
MTSNRKLTAAEAHAYLASLPPAGTPAPPQLTPHAARAEVQAPMPRRIM